MESERRVGRSRDASPIGGLVERTAVMANRREALEKLWRELKEEEAEEARDALVVTYRPLVRHVALRLKGKLPHRVELQEMVSAGMIGLIQAIDKFEPERGFLFETYCSMRIKGAILDDLRDKDWVPRSVRKKAHRLEKARLELAFEFRREPTDEEVAGHLGLDTDEFEALLSEVEVHEQLPIEGGHSENFVGKEVSRVELLEDREAWDPVEALALGELHEVAMRGLSALERAVIDGYYFRGKTMKEIGAGVGISESRVCQIHAQVIKFLRHRLGDSWGPDAAPKAA